MIDKRESDLWKQIDRLIFIISVLGLIILVGAYFIIANLQTIDAIIRNFVLNIIVNIIPTFLLFIGAYLVFRHIEKLRSERDTDELADKVLLKLTQALSEARANNPGAASTFPQVSKLKLKIYDEFDITNRKFEDASNPQKLIFSFYKSWK
jgi:heme/copper-type cytochrome/quinol oxidase subunit 2